MRTAIVSCQPKNFLSDAKNFLILRKFPPRYLVSLAPLWIWGCCCCDEQCNYITAVTLVWIRLVDTTKQWITAYKVLVSNQKKVIMSGVGYTSVNVCMNRGSTAQPETGTSIVVILHKTLNLTIIMESQDLFLAFGDSFALGINHHSTAQKASPEHTI